MNFKEKLLELRKRFIGVEEPAKIETQTTENSNENQPISIDLNDKVDEFIKWYFKNMVKGQYTNIGEYYQPNQMRNFIEKMAVWYELRYPEYEVNRLFPGSSQEQTQVNDVMFKSNPYLNEFFDEKSDIRYLDWDDFYNTKVFINSLPWEEKIKLSKPLYSDIVYLSPKFGGVHLHLTKNGIVEMAENVSIYTNSVIKDEELEGLHVKKVIELFKNRGIALPPDNGLEKAVEYADKYLYQKEEMLNCVMYRIIERGGNRIGPRRAFLFAKEFKRNIDIPMMYGVDLSDPGLRKFMNEYLKAGGSKDLVCHVGYFSKASKQEKLYTVSIKRLILYLNNDAVTFYTPEETELHQKLANALNYKLGQDIRSRYK